MPVLEFRRKGGIRPQWPRGIRRLPELKTAQETITANFVVLASVLEALYEQAWDSEFTAGIAIAGKAQFHKSQIKFLQALHEMELSAQTDYQEIIDEIKIIFNDERSLNLRYFIEQNDNLLLKMSEKAEYLEEKISLPNNIDYLDSEYANQFALNPYEFSIKQMEFLSKIIVDTTFTMFSINHNIQYEGRNANEKFINRLLREFENVLTALQMSMKTVCNLYVWSPLKDQKEQFELLDKKFQKAGETIDFAKFVRKQIEDNLNEKQLGKALESLTYI